MNSSVQDVLKGEGKWAVTAADALDFLRSLPADSVDLVMASPPYEKARSYSMGFDKAGEDWVAWMVEVFRAASACCTGLVCMVVEGQTKDYRWSAVPALLMADLHRAGLHLRKPPAYYRIGIPGSGGPDWLRNDYELCVCTARPGRLPWSDNKAAGHPLKFKPGGDMNNRLTDGRRVKEVRATSGEQYRQGQKNGYASSEDRQRVGSHRARRQAGRKYQAPDLANPGNVINCGAVGGGNIGSKLAHDNEAPYPEGLVEPFVRSFCPPDGVVADCFAGSGTTGAVSVRWGRRFVGCDVRESQVQLACRRIAGETPTLFPGKE